MKHADSKYYRKSIRRINDAFEKMSDAIMFFDYVCQQESSPVRTVKFYDGKINVVYKKENK